MAKVAARVDAVARTAELMTASPFLHDVPPKIVERFASTGSVRRYRRGTYVCHQQDPAPEIYFLVEGKLEISSAAPTGTRIFHAAIDEPAFVGELAILGAMPRTATVLAVRDSDVWAAAATSFVDVVATEPAASRAALQALARQVQAHQALVDDLLFLDLKGRVAKRLLQMVTPDLEHLPPDGAVVPEVTQADLASLCGGSRENVTRILKEFERRGVVHRDEHRYVLKKVSALAKIAGR